MSSEHNRSGIIYTATDQQKPSHKPHQRRDMNGASAASSGSLAGSHSVEEILQVNGDDEKRGKPVIERASDSTRSMVL